MATARDYRLDFNNIVKLLSANLIGKAFTFEYRAAGLGGSTFIASGDENGVLTNCEYGKKEDGTTDKSVIIVALNYLNFPPTGGVYAKRLFGSDLSIEEYIAPNEGGDYNSYVGTDTAYIEEINALKKQIANMKGDDPTSESAQTAKIDSEKEVHDFLEGYDNTKKLKDVVAGSVDSDGIVHY